MKKYLKYLFIITVIFSCNNHEEKNKETSIPNNAKNKIIRYGMVTGVKPDKLDYYKNIHAHPWPAVIKKIAECNIHNYSIYLQKMNNNYFLFSYFEYVGENFNGDMQKMAADTTTQRWWKETDPCQLPLPEAAAKKEIWTKMEEVFHED